MTAPLLPSWHWDKETQTIEMWARWSDAPPDASVSGPVAAMLVDVLSWTYEQTRLPDPEPEPAEPEGPSSADLREWAQESRAVADAALRLAQAIAWEADR